MKKIIIILFATFFLTGCWSSKELNEIAIVNAIGIDLKDDEYVVSAQVMNPKKESAGTKGDQTDSIVYTGRGKSILESLRNITLEAPKRLNVSHLELLIINEDAARKGVDKIADQFLRESETRNECILLVTEDDQKAADILGIMTPLELYPSQNILESIEISKKYQGTTTNTRFDEFTEEILKPGISPVTSSVKVVNKKKSGYTKENLEQAKTTTYVKLGKIALFRDYKLKGFLSDDESFYFNLVDNNNKNGVLNIPCDDTKNSSMTIEIIQSKAKIDSKITEDEINGTVKISMTANLAEVQCKEDVSGNKSLHDIEIETQKFINKKVKNTIKKTQKYQTDVFGFGKNLYQNDYRNFEPLLKKWDTKYYPEMKINVKTEVNLIDTGNLVDSVKGASDDKKQN